MAELAEGAEKVKQDSANAVVLTSLITVRWIMWEMSSISSTRMA